MIIMEKGATQEQINDVIDEIKKHGLRVDISRGEFRTVIGLIGDESKISFANLSIMPGVKEARMVETPYKLISRDYSDLFINKDESRIVKVGDVRIGGDDPVFIAGPCAVESREQIFRIAREVKGAGAHILRGGIYKPRSSVHSFQGLGSQGEAEAREALGWLRAAGREYDMPVMTEVRGEYQTELIGEYVDILQIGARNMYDQDLLSRVGRTGKPVLFKRHFGASIEEFLSFSEYIVAEGNKDVILCERGIVPVGKGNSYTRYTLDLGAVPVVRRETYLPIIVDPSHAAGRRDLIFDMSCAAIAVGAHGLVIETHYNPKEAIVDAKQMITPGELKDVIDATNQISKITTFYRKKIN
ncbi:MAG: 3-deoxy-7-phosphoheptulonate synthase [Dehalococcoidales bacterium]|jgi:3-deoxy-7-phosphoheptulonate synthase|nr:3-deoxy-7-phosphoheptulonate synthase [Dehalococcoidales bacterium]